MSESLKEFINNYVNHFNHLNVGELLSMHRLPFVFRGLNGECLCMCASNQIESHVKNKFGRLINNEAPKVFVDYAHQIGHKFLLLKERHLTISGLIRESTLITTTDTGKHWIIGEHETKITYPQEGSSTACI